MSTPAIAVIAAPMRRTSPDRDVDAADAREHADGAEVDVDRRQAGGDVGTREVRRREPGGAVGADGEERDVAEIEQPRVADDHVQAERHHHVDGHRSPSCPSLGELVKIGTLPDQSQFSASRIG